MNEVYAQYFEEPFPARAAGVASFPKAALVGLEAIAVRSKHAFERTTMNNMMGWSQIPILPLILASLIFFACASPQQRLTGAAMLGNEDKLAELLRSGADLDAPAVVSGGYQHCPSRAALTPLQGAACAGRVGAVKLLLDHKADPRAKGAAGESALIFAVRQGHPDVAKLLLERGSGIDARDAQGRPVLNVAAREGHAFLTRFLLDRGADVDGTDPSGATALMEASNKKTAELLLARKASIGMLNDKGSSALHEAAARGRPGVVKLLLEHGADAELKDDDGATALSLARAGKHTEAVGVLEKEQGRLIRKQLSAAERAAGAGDQDSALVLYTNALDRARDLSGEVGGSLDSEIRAKIIKYVAGWSEPPSVPSKAREHVVRANYLLKQGRSASLVLEEMTAAVDAAPWWAEGYYNLGLMHGDQKQFKEAMKMLQLFVDAAPTSPKAQEAQNKIFEFKIAQEEVEKIAGMAGDWSGYLVSVEGDRLGISGDGKVFTLNINNNTLEGSVQSEPYGGSHNCTIPGQFHPVTGTLNDDRNRLELEFVWNSYDTSYHCVDMFGLAANCCLMCSEVCDAVSIVSTTNQHVQLSR